MEYTCQDPACGATFTRPPTRGQRPKWCPDCRGPNGGRGPVALACAVCGTVTAKAASKIGTRTVCSPACRAFLRFGCNQPSRADWEAAQPPRVLFVAGRCKECATPFVALDLSGESRYCSNACYRRWSRRRHFENRRAREFAAFVEAVDRRAVFEADGWRCHLCGGQTDPDDYEWRTGSDGRPAFCTGPSYPTLDHVVALNNGGMHSPANARTAHMRCNAIKGDRP